MLIPTPSGVIAAQAYAGKGFGSADTSAEHLTVEPCDITVAAYSGPTVTVMGLDLAASQRVLMSDRSWKAAGELEAGDSLAVWPRGDDEPDSVIGALVGASSSCFVITAPYGCLVGATPASAWIMVG